MSEEAIEAWKKQYESVYRLEILDQVFIFRVLGVQEYAELLELNLSEGEYQEAVCKKAVLYPADFDFSSGLAGFAEAVADAVLDCSGLHAHQGKELLEQYRQEMQILDHQAACIIHEAFPEYSLEEILNWSAKKVMYYLSRAEWILATLRGINLQYVEHNAAKPELPPPDNRQSNSKPSKGTLTQEDVERMLSEKTGKQVTPHNTSIEDLPEFQWFQAEDELKGEFD